MYSPRQTDIWSMGVLLVNMISGRNPWRVATSTDHYFQAYLKDNDSLGEVFPISAEVITIIKRIFVLNPFQRITLEDLREEIVRVRTFSRGRQHTRQPARVIDLEQPIELVDSTMRIDSEPRSSQPARSTSLERVIYTSPIVEMPATRNRASGSNRRPITPGVFNFGSGVEPINGSSPATDSSPAVTPSAHATAPLAVAGPDSGLDINIEGLPVPQDAPSVKDPRSPERKTKPIVVKDGCNLIRAAIQHIKGFFTSTGNSTS